MRFWVVAMLIALAGATLAGCLGPGDAADAGDDPAGQRAVDGTPISFGGNTSVPMGGSNASAHFAYTGHTGAEPNMGITSSGTIFATAFEETIRSTDGGLTWEVVQEYAMVQGLSPIGTSDPMMWVDTLTDRVFVNHMFGTNCFNMLWSDDEGGTWTQRDFACATPSVDHQKVATGPLGPDAPAIPMPIYPNVVYTCYNKFQIGATDCFMSYDGGLTYPVESQALWRTRGDSCAGAAGHPAVAPDGTIALAVGWNCGPLVAVSTDSGLTWSVHDGPSEHGSGASIDPDISFSPDGEHMFLMWRGEDHMTYVARSSDLGASWGAVWNVTTPGLTSTRFHVLAAGDDGRLAMAYLGTRYDDDSWEHAPIDAPPNATWHLFIVTAEGADSEAPGFAGYQVTPEGDPVQVGCSWEGGGGGGDRQCRNMLDFIDSAVAPNGTYYVVYTEGCTVRGECAPFDSASLPDEMDSRDREVAIAWLEGWSLLSN